MENLSSCTYTTFSDPALSSDEKCSIANSMCGAEYSLINFISFAVCDLPGTWLFYIISIVMIYLIFKFISETIECYISPSIVYITEYLKMSEALAAVTFLALANGAGDVITALVASGESGGVSYNIGSIFGAGLFVLTIVVAVTIKKAGKDLELEASIIYRDILYYIIATVFTICVGIYGELTVWTSILMLVIYGSMVVVVIIQDKIKNKEDEETKVLLDDNESALKNEAQTLRIKSLKDGRDEKENDSVELVRHHQKEGNEGPQGKKTIGKGAFYQASKKIMVGVRFQLMYAEAKKKYLEEQREAKFSSMSIFQKIIYIIDFPFIIAKKATMPPCEENEFSRFWSLVFPIPFFLFILISSVFKIYIIDFIIALPLGIALMIAIYVYSENGKRPKFFILLAFMGVIGGLMWTYVVSSVLIDLLQAIGVLVGLDKTYLGLTIIAVGNALPDALTTTTLAAQGYAIMGISGGYAGQLFGLLVGFGIAMLKQTLIAGPQAFDIFNPSMISANILPILVLFVALLTLVVTFIYGIWAKYTFKNSLGYALFAIYGIFITTATVIAIVKIVQTKSAQSAH